MTKYEMKWDQLKNALLFNKTVSEVYASRWVWYHTILAFELLLIIIIQLLILAKI